MATDKQLDRMFSDSPQLYDSVLVRMYANAKGIGPRSLQYKALMAAAAVMDRMFDEMCDACGDAKFVQRLHEVYREA